jgi:U4/U6.U5 tri-snRNP-associated protein 2
VCVCIWHGVWYVCAPISTISTAKFFQGRGSHTPAYFHSLQAVHNLFLNLETTRVYCLPDGYEVVDDSLNDIKSILAPRFTREQVLALDSKPSKRIPCVGEVEQDFVPGLIGLNNLKHTDGMNVVLQALIQIPPLRCVCVVLCCVVLCCVVSF